VLTTARLVPKKGFAAIIEAATLLRNRHLSFNWELVGEGPLRSDLEFEISAAGLESHVRLRGALSNRDALALLRRSDVFVLPCVRLPSGDSDGLPAALIESVALGVPVVTTSVAAIPELVHHGETGVIVPQRDGVAVANAVESLYLDRELYDRISEQGQRVGLHEYVLEDQVGRLRSFLSTCVNQSPS
jgi:glycosyltransferase involved in cell wall biosynthesis